MNNFLDKVEEEVNCYCGTMLNKYQLGMCLKVIEDRTSGTETSGRCNKLQHKLLGDDK